jgi:hypothetical protein
MSRSTKWTLPKITTTILTVIASTIRREVELEDDDGNRPDLIKGDYVLHKQRNGQPVRLLNAGKIKSVGSIGTSVDKIVEAMEGLLETLSSRDKDSKAFKLWERIGSPTEVYRRTSIRWKDENGNWYGGPMFAKLVQLWNESKGDLDHVQDGFGKDEFGDLIFPKAAIKPKIKGIREDFTEKSMPCPLYLPLDEVEELDDDTLAAMVSDIASDLEFDD